jgi:hypothetical protein
MKFAISPYELFALTRHLSGQQSPNPEHGRKRLRTWDELGVADLADKLAGFGGEITIAEWKGRGQADIELSESVIDFILAGLKQPVEGAWADVLTRLGDRLEAEKKA